jgi:hypothetical protein
MQNKSYTGEKDFQSSALERKYIHWINLLAVSDQCRLVKDFTLVSQLIILYIWEYQQTHINDEKTSKSHSNLSKV